MNSGQILSSEVAFTATVFLALVLLDHLQHALLKDHSTQRVWHYACADVLPSRLSLKCIQKNIYAQAPWDITEIIIANK